MMRIKKFTVFRTVFELACVGKGQRIFDCPVYISILLTTKDKHCIPRSSSNESYCLQIVSKLIDPPSAFLEKF